MSVNDLLPASRQNMLDLRLEVRGLARTLYAMVKHMEILTQFLARLEKFAETHATRLESIVAKQDELKAQIAAKNAQLDELVAKLKDGTITDEEKTRMTQILDTVEKLEKVLDPNDPEYIPSEPSEPDVFEDDPQPPA